MPPPTPTTLKKLRSAGPPPPEYRDAWTIARAALRRLRQYLGTGLLVWVPFFITIWVSWWVFSGVVLRINGLIEWAVRKVQTLTARIPYFEPVQDWEYQPWIGLLLALALFITTGFLTRYVLWRQSIALLEALVAKIPVISTVYTSVQQIRDVFVSSERGVFQEIVLMEYPRAGVYVIGFVTSRDQGLVQSTAGRELAAVFLPTTPNPTSGYLLYVPVDELITLNVTTEDAMKMIMSGGAYYPGMLPESGSEGTPAKARGKG